jgi:uncharacterized membrane protein
MDCYVEGFFSVNKGKVLIRDLLSLIRLRVFLLRERYPQMQMLLLISFQIDGDHSAAEYS